MLGRKEKGRVNSRAEETKANVNRRTNGKRKIIRSNEKLLLGARGRKKGTIKIHDKT